MYDDMNNNKQNVLNAIDQGVDQSEEDLLSEECSRKF